MLLVTHVEDSLLVLRQEYMWTNKHMVCVNAEVMLAGAHLSAQFDELLEEPAATVTHTAVSHCYLQVQLLRSKA